MGGLSCLVYSVSFKPTKIPQEDIITVALNVDYIFKYIARLL